MVENIPRYAAPCLALLHLLPGFAVLYPLFWIGLDGFQPDRIHPVQHMGCVGHEKEEMTSYQPPSLAGRAVFIFRF